MNMRGLEPTREQVDQEEADVTTASSAPLQR